MALYIPHSIFHLVRLLYVRQETFGPYYICLPHTSHVKDQDISSWVYITEVHFVPSLTDRGIIIFCEVRKDLQSITLGRGVGEEWSESHRI
jgi:hypothetical protein